MLKSEAMIAGRVSDGPKNTYLKVFKSEAMITGRVSDGPKNTYLSVSGSGFRSNFESTIIYGTSGVKDGVKISDLGYHLFFSMNGVESSSAFTSSM